MILMRINSLTTPLAVPSVSRQPALLRHMDVFKIQRLSGKQVDRQSTLQSLPQAALDGLFLLLDDENHEVQRRAFNILTECPNLPITPAYITKPELFTFWLEESFEQQISVYRQGGTLFLNMPKKLKHAPLSFISSRMFLWNIRRTRTALEMPEEDYTRFWPLF